MLGLAALVLACFWVFSTQQLRFFLVAALPLLSLLALSLTWLEARSGPRVALGAGAALLALSVAWTAPLAAGLWRRQETTAWLSGATDREALLGRLLPESYPVYRELPALVPPGETVWLVWMRGYTYYLDRPYRLDAFLEGWRLEALLEAAASPRAAAAALARERIRFLLVNERFFLAPESVDVTPGRTALLASRFAALRESGLLSPVRRWGPVVLYRTGPADPSAPATPRE
jgi:hypothetical protein